MKIKIDGEMYKVSLPWRDRIALVFVLFIAGFVAVFCMVNAFRISRDFTSVEMNDCQKIAEALVWKGLSGMEEEVLTNSSNKVNRILLDVLTKPWKDIESLETNFLFVIGNWKVVLNHNIISFYSLEGREKYIEAIFDTEGKIDLVCIESEFKSSGFLLVLGISILIVPFISYFVIGPITIREKEREKIRALKKEMPFEREELNQ